MTPRLTITDNTDLNGPPLVEYDFDHFNFGEAVHSYNCAARDARINAIDGFVNARSTDATVTVNPVTGAITGLSFILTDERQHSLTIAIEEDA